MSNRQTGPPRRSTLCGIGRFHPVTKRMYEFKNKTVLVTGQPTASALNSPNFCQDGCGLILVARNVVNLEKSKIL